MKELNVHPYPVRILFSCNVIEYNMERSERYSLEPVPDRANGCCTHSGDRFVNLVGVFDNSMATLAHELNHAVINLFYAVGMPVNVVTAEAYCYLYDSLFSQCCELMTTRPYFNLTEDDDHGDR